MSGSNRPGCGSIDADQPFIGKAPGVAACRVSLTKASRRRVGQWPGRGDFSLGDGIDRGTQPVGGGGVGVVQRGQDVEQRGRAQLDEGLPSPRRLDIAAAFLTDRLDPAQQRAGIGTPDRRGLEKDNDRHQQENEGRKG